MQDESSPERWIDQSDASPGFADAADLYTAPPTRGRNIGRTGRARVVGIDRKDKYPED